LAIKGFSNTTVTECLLDLITENDNSTSKLCHLQNKLAAYRQQSPIDLTTYHRVNAGWDDEDKKAFEQFEKDLSPLSSQGGTETTKEPTTAAKAPGKRKTKAVRERIIGARKQAFNEYGCFSRASIATTDWPPSTS
jgi:hypothetical protein